MDVQHGSGLSPFGAARTPPTEDERRRARRRRILLAGVRYGVPAAVFMAGVVILVAEPDRGVALEAGFMFFGVAIAILLLNLFFRLGVQGDVQRDREEEAREYFDRHGRWPGERS